MHFLQNMGQIKISIIAPVYCVPEHFLRECIDSLISQTYRNIEIILVDDGSPDDCGKICDEYAVKDNRIKVIHKENGGLVSARNAGYRIASGDWFCFMDSDDWLSLDAMEKLVKQIEQNEGLDVIFWKVVNEINGKQVTGKWEWPENEYTKVYLGEQCRDLALDTLVYKLGVASPVIRLVNMEYAKRCNVTHDDRTKQGMEGIVFAMRSFYYAQKVLFINEYFYHYRYNPSSISKSVSEKNVQCILDCINVMEEDIASFSNREDFKQPMYEKAIYLLLAMAMNTYFHPANQESLFTRTRKFSNVINRTPLFKEAIYKAKGTELDKQRRLAWIVLKMKLYFLLDIFGKAKQILLKRGKYNY